MGFIEIDLLLFFQKLTAGGRDYGLSLFGSCGENQENINSRGTEIQYMDVLDLFIFFILIIKKQTVLEVGISYGINYDSWLKLEEEKENLRF